MVISQPAVICLEATTDRVRRVWAAFRGGPAEGAWRASAGSRTEAVAAVLPVGRDADERGESDPDAAPTPLTAPERRARAAAFRGLLLARQRRFAEAEAAFAAALRLDPALDPTTIPTFWELERGGHEAVVGAYQAVDRTGDAATLSARLRRTYRPRLVRTRAAETPALAPR